MIHNPVLRKELLMRMRLRPTTPGRVSVAIAVVALIVYLYYQAITSLLVNPRPGEAHGVWLTVIWIQMLLICLVAPAIAANAIAQEKEQQTWEMLIFTRLRPDEIVLGKLIARMAIVLFLIALGVPISLYAMFYANVGGTGSENYVSAPTFISSYLTLLLSGLFFATFGLFMSWKLSRTLYALITSYTFVIGGLLLVTTLVTWLLTYLISDNNFFYSCPLMWFNPVVLLLEASEQSSYVPQAPLYLTYGLSAYVLLTALMLWRIIAGFRRPSDR